MSIPNGFFMGWVNTLNGEGYEYHLLFIGVCIALLFVGGGKYSVDGLLAH
jgi:putative oxidoreductase